MKASASRLRASLAELTVEQTALLLSVGLVLGVFPIMGFPTVLCLLAAFGLRLNLVALQLLNNVSSPLQLALLLPLARAGTKLCGGAPTAGASWTGTIGSAALHGVAGWRDGPASASHWGLCCTGACYSSCAPQSVRSRNGILCDGGIR
jgi:hypothetical protein